MDHDGTSAIGDAADWITALLAGSAATALCVVAIATLGLLMLTGRLPLRHGLQVVLGCFLLLGASTIAAELHGLGAAFAGKASRPMPAVIEPEPPLPPANHDPYAGASFNKR